MGECGTSAGIYVRLDDPSILSFIHETAIEDTYVLVAGSGHLELLNLNKPSQVLSHDSLTRFSDSYLSTLFRFEESFSGILPSNTIFTCGGRVAHWNQNCRKYLENFVITLRSIEICSNTCTGCPSSIFHSLSAYNSETVHFWPHVGKAKMRLRVVHLFWKL